MEYAGLEKYVAEPIIGGGCFIVGAATWQSAIIHRFVLRCYGDIAPWEVTEWLVEENFLKPAFRPIPVQRGTEMKKYLKAAVPHFRPPEDVVTEFMLGLARQGLIYKGRTRWSSRTPNAEKARSEWNQAKAAEKRWQEIKVVLVAIQKDAKRGADINLQEWATIQHVGLNDTPDEIVWAGKYGCEDLIGRLRYLSESLKPGAYPASGSLLGLPLEEDQESRRREQLDRQETMRLADERRKEVAAEQRRQETRLMLTKIRSAAGNLMGAEAGGSWLSRQLPGGLDRAEDLDLNSQQRNSLQSAFDTERYRLAEVEQAQASASALALRCLDELKLMAERDPKLLLPDRVEAWMGGFQRSLGVGGARPRDFCVDRNTLGQCLVLLPSRLPKTRRSQGR